MRTKQLLLTVAALLAAGLLKTQATPVYSQNIVGYATLSAPSASTYYLMAIPFVIGVSNGADEVFGLNANPGNLPIGTEILTFDVPSQSYIISFYDPTTSPPWWDSASENYNMPTPDLPVGQAFFLLPASGVTNTFVGTVAVSIGGSNVMSMPSASTYYMVASVVPYAGAVTNGSLAGGGMNLNGMPIGSEVLTFDVPSQSYNIAFWDPTTFPTPWWDSASENYNVPVPTAQVGQGFFVLPADSYKWTNSLPGL